MLGEGGSDYLCHIPRYWRHCNLLNRCHWLWVRHSHPTNPNLYSNSNKRGGGGSKEVVEEEVEVDKPTKIYTDDVANARDAYTPTAAGENGRGKYSIDNDEKTGLGDTALEDVGE